MMGKHLIHHLAVLALMLILLPVMSAAAVTCLDDQGTPQVPTDRDLTECHALLPTARNPRALPLDQYEAALSTFLAKLCYRDAASGWKRDKTVREVASTDVVEFGSL